MNTSKFLENSQKLLSLDSNLGLQASLTNLLNTLGNLVSNPTHLPFQQELEARIAELGVAFDKLDHELNPALNSFFREVAPQNFFSSELATELRSWSSAASITPSVLHQRVSQLHSARQNFLALLQQTVNGLKTLGLNASEQVIGEAEVGFTIPRPLFNDNLDGLIKELNFIKRLLNTLQELSGHTGEQPQLKQLATSDPSFIFGIDLDTYLIFGAVITWSLSTIESIKKLVSAKSASETSGAFTKSELEEIFDKKIKQLQDSSTRDEAKELVSASAVEKARANELENRLAMALQGLLWRIEHGVQIELRFLPPPSEVGDAKEQIAKKSSELQEQIESLQKNLSKYSFDGTKVLQLPSTDEQAEKAIKRKDK